MARIRLVNIVKRFGDFAAVKKLNLEISDKEFLVLLGPSGCGKTTTLRSIAGLETVDEGEIWVDDIKVNDVRASERDIAFVFQLYALYPHLTAYENIAFPLKAQGEPAKSIKMKVEQVAKILQIEHILKRKPGALSGGDMQRVALGRAMVRRPKAFLMDEPIGTLDARFREEMRAELKRLHLDIGATTVYVTHDQVEAMSMGDRIAIMNLGELQQVGTPMEVYNHPANLFVANFIGSPGMNFTDCKYIREANGTPAVEFVSSHLDMRIPLQYEKKISEKYEEGKELVLGIRPEDITVRSERIDGALQAEVYVVEPLGPNNIIDIKIGNNILKARSPASFKPKIGGAIWFKFDIDRIHLFDKKTGEAII
jgi:multiple sugar transport system ATP-binding protein